MIDGHVENLEAVMFLLSTQTQVETGYSGCNLIWAAAWQNQQNDCAPSKDSDQPGHPLSLIWVFAVRSMGSEGPKLSSCGQWRLIRLGKCPGWSESLLDAQVILLVLSCGSSFLIQSEYWGAHVIITATMISPADILMTTHEPLYNTVCYNTVTTRFIITRFWL